MKNVYKCEFRSILDHVLACHGDSDKICLGAILSVNWELAFGQDLASYSTKFMYHKTPKTIWLVVKSHLFDCFGEFDTF